MELYYKDLISTEGSLEKLVDDLMLVVQGVGAFAEAAGAYIPDAEYEELRTRLERLREGCRRIKQHAVDGAVATDKVLHRYPYSFTGFAFGLGLLAGAIAKRYRR